ncbi:HDOD domain-containing protein [Vibrio sp. RC27]
MEEISLNIICVDDDELMLKTIGSTINDLRPHWKVLYCNDPLAWRDEWSYSDIEAPAVFISDLQMARKRGDQLLDEIKNIFPDAIRVLLTSDNDESFSGRAHNYAHFVLPKPLVESDFERLFLCAEQLDKMPFNDECRRNLGAFTDLPVLPDSVMRLQRVLGSPSCDNHKVADVISHEPALVARVFQTANSPYLGFRVSTESLPDAVGRLGMTLVESLAIEQLLSISNKRLSTNRHIAVTENALKIGEVSRVLARKLHLSLNDQDKVFIASLLTSIGALVLLEEGANESELDHYIGLQEGMSDSHIIAAYVLIMWGYEIDISEAILHQRKVNFESEDIGVLRSSIVGLATQIVSFNTKQELLDLAETLPNTVAEIVVELSTFRFDK